MRKLRVLALMHDYMVPPEDTSGHDLASVEWKTEYDVTSTLRDMGHDVRIVAPQFEGAMEPTEHVLRTPALQKFNGSDFSVRLPLMGGFTDAMNRFRPQIVHSHHPFLLGDIAIRGENCRTTFICD